MKIALQFVFSQGCSTERCAEVFCEGRPVPYGADARFRRVGVVDKGGAISRGEEVVVVDDLER